MFFRYCVNNSVIKILKYPNTYWCVARNERVNDVNKISYICKENVINIQNTEIFLKNTLAIFQRDFLIGSIFRLTI